MWSSVLNGLSYQLTSKGILTPPFDDNGDQKCYKTQQQGYNNAQNDEGLQIGKK